jgi:hypothetical protein
MQMDKMAKFLEEAFCIDGDCKFYPHDAPKGVTYKLTDTKRGIFYITISKEKNVNEIGE